MIIEDINRLDAHCHMLVNEFVEFFEIFEVQRDSGQETFNIAESAETTDQRALQKTSSYGHRYTLGGDDEVVLQNPYEDEGENGRGSSCVVIIQEDAQSKYQNANPLESQQSHDIAVHIGTNFSKDEEEEEEDGRKYDSESSSTDFEHFKY